MTRRHLLAIGAFAPMVNFGRCRLFGATGPVYSTRVVDLVARSLVIDMLGLLTLDWPKLARWQASPENFTASDFEQMRSTGIDVLHPAVDLGAVHSFREISMWLREWRDFIEQHPAQFQAVRTCADLKEAKQSGRIGILLGLQNSKHFRTAGDVAYFFSKGQRISQLTYNESNRLGSGCSDRMDAGLSSFGVDIVSAMNAVGMVIDVSHAGERTTLDAIAASGKPLLITHSNCRALVQHPRCKSDAVIRAMSQKGGVMGITGVKAFLSQRARPTIEDVLDHFDHVARLVGVEHLGIGSDAGADGSPARHLDVEGLNQPRRVFDLAQGLMRRRYSEMAIEGILGGNFQRALQSIFC
jgi:membrane dipeptidase